MSPGRPLLSLLLILLTLIAARDARAEETDFLPDNLSWNGLSELSDLMNGMQLQLLLLEELDWSRLPDGATLLLIHPRASLDPDDLIAFLRGGGRVLIADDFGAAAPLLDRLGIQRHGGEGIRAAWNFDSNPHLPVARRGSVAHQLNDGVEELITNHPAFFSSDLPTIMGFARGQQLVVAGRVAAGKIVALADPSVLINRMLAFEGNLTFATNLLRHLQPSSGNQIFLCTRHFRVRGKPGGDRPAAAVASPPQRFLTEYNQFLDHLNDFALTDPALRSLAFVCGSLALVGLLLFLPLPRRSLDGHWLRPESTIRGSLEEMMQRFGRRRLVGGAGFPAEVLREELDDILSRVIPAPGPISTVHPGWVVRQVRATHGEEAAQVCTRLLSLLRQVSHATPDADSRRIPRIQPRDLMRAYDLAARLLALMGSDVRLPSISDRPERPATVPADSRSEHGTSR